MNSTIEQFSKQDRKKAEALLDRVNELLDTTRATQEKLQRNYAEVGAALFEVQKTKAWMIQFKSWDSYLKHAEGRFGRGRTALYGYVGIARELSDSVASRDLVEMGITKASALAQMVKATGHKPTPELVEKAKTLTADRLSIEIAEESGLRGYEDKGSYFDLGGVFFSAEEQNEFFRAADIAVKTDPPLNKPFSTWPDASPHMKKEILQRWLQEYLSAYEAEVLQGQV